MSLSKLIRKIWHDIYYSMVSKDGVEFAMRCKDVAHQVDLKASDLDWKGKFRFYLHLSLCQACHNYYVLSQFLGSKLRKLVGRAQVTPQNLEQLNKDLVQKYKQN